MIVMRITHLYVSSSRLSLSSPNTNREGKTSCKYLANSSRFRTLSTAQSRNVQQTLSLFSRHNSPFIEPSAANNFATITYRRTRIIARWVNSRKHNTPPHLPSSSLCFMKTQKSIYTVCFPCAQTSTYRQIRTKTAISVTCKLLRETCWMIYIL